MRFTVLVSSSRGNVTYVEAGGLRLLIDIGLACRTLEKQFKALDLSPDGLDGILITHEHCDHIGGLTNFLKKHPTPVFANYNTAAVIEHQCRQAKQPVPEFALFETGVPFMLGELTITPLPIPHDTAEPVGYVIHDGQHQLGYFTDLGYVPDPVLEAIHHCHALILESNYDPQLLRNSNRGFHLISRISGRAGHLSNEQACEAVATAVGAPLQTLTLAHLSRECNQPDIAEAMMRGTLRHIGRTDVALAIANPDTPLPFTTLESL